jgi:hypothetical protein
MTFQHCADLSVLYKYCSISSIDCTSSRLPSFSISKIRDFCVRWKNRSLLEIRSYGLNDGLVLQPTAKYQVERDVELDVFKLSLAKFIRVDRGCLVLVKADLIWTPQLHIPFLGRLPYSDRYERNAEDIFKVALH